MPNVLYIFCGAVILFLFVGFYKLGYYTGRLDELQDEKAMLDEWEKSDAELFDAWQKNIEDLTGEKEQ